MVRAGRLFSDITYVKREKTFGNSRFDLYVEHGGQKHYIEVKGVTLEVDGIARFPDAPTERGIKHIHELMEMCIRDRSYMVPMPEEITDQIQILIL